MITPAEFRKTLRAIALPFVFSSIGLMTAFLLKKGLKLELSKPVLSLITLVVTSVAVLGLFPRVFGIPFGPVTLRQFLDKLGLTPAHFRPAFLFLGVLAALFTLSGMLTGSLLTGKYSFDPATLSLGQILFALTPGIWEEILFRGVMMVVLLRLTGSFKKAALIQILIFGLAHIKGFGPWDLVDAFSVMVIAFAFTYLAWKTKSLIPGILFHWLHDSFLFVVQLPDGEYAGVTDNLYFYFSLWLFIGLLLLTLRVAGRRFTPDGIHDIYAAAEVES